MIHFHYPHSFYFFIPFGFLCFLFLWSKWQRRRDLERLGDLHVIRNMVSFPALTRRRIKDRLALIGLAVVLFALTGPQWGAKYKEVKQRGVDVFIAMDTSLSMLAEDVSPNRLDRAKRSLGLLIEKLAGNRIGIIAFTKTALIQCPLTVDSESARMFLEILDEKSIPVQGTSLGEAIRTALKGFTKDDKSGRAIVLLTDGEDHKSDPLGAAKEAKEAGVVIFTIGIGTSKGEVIKNKDESGNVTEFHKYKGQMVMSKLDDGLLSEIASITGGKYYRASSTDNEIDDIADQLLNFDKKEFASKLFERYEERYVYFLFVGFLLLLIEFFFAEMPGQASRVGAFLLLTAGKIRRPFAKTLPLILFGLLLASMANADMKDLVKKGNRLVKKGDFSGARVQFESAQIDAPEAPFIPYNIANTYYLEGNFEEAERNYNRAMGMTMDPGLKSKIAYNLGHLYYNFGKTEESLLKFKECLKFNPTDMDAKYNIEYIKAGKKPKSPPQKNKDDKNSQDKKDKKDEENSDKEKKDGKDNKEDEKNKNEQSKENAERILQMINEQEKERLKNGKEEKVNIYNKEKDKNEQQGEDW